MGAHDASTESALTPPPDDLAVVSDQAMSTPPGAPEDDGLGRPQRDLLALGAGVLACVVVIAGAVLNPDTRAAVPPSWWAAVLGYVLCFLGAALFPRATRAPLLLAVAQVLLGLVVVALAPGYQLAGLLTVVSAGSLALWLPLPACLVVIAAQTAVLAAVAVRESGAGGPPSRSRSSSGRCSWSPPWSSTSADATTCTAPSWLAWPASCTRPGRR